MKKSIAILLTVLLAASVAGCGGGPDSSKAETQSKAETSTGAGGDSSAAEPEQTGFQKYDPPVTVRMARQIDAAMDQDLKTWNMTYDDNVWTKALLEEYGIQIEYVFLSQGDDFKTKMNASVASGDLLDVASYDSTQLAQLHENGLLANLQPSFDQYASDLQKELTYSDGGLAMKSAMLGGELAGIPGICDPRCDVIFYRQDWLDKLNLKMPTNMDEFWEVAEAFTTGDPDGNGKNDTFGVSLSKDLSSVGSIKAILNGYHAYWDQWVKLDDGSIVYSNIQPEMKTALAKMAEMYQKGVIDPEFVTKDGNKVGEDAAAQKTGIVPGEWWMSEWPLNTSYEANPDVKVNWEASPLVSADDKPVKPQHGLTVAYGYYAVPASFEHPEAMIQMFNFWWENMYGQDISQETYQIYSSGPNKETFWKLSPVTSFIGEDVRCVNIEEAIQSGDASKLTLEEQVYYQNAVKYQETGDSALRPHDKMYGVNGSQGIMSKNYFNGEGNITPPAFYGAPTPTMADKAQTLLKMSQEVFTKIIMGEESIDAFDKFVTDWKSLGGDQITTEVNEWAKTQE